MKDIQIYRKCKYDFVRNRHETQNTVTRFCLRNSQNDHYLRVKSTPMNITWKFFSSRNSLITEEQDGLMFIVLPRLLFRMKPASRSGLGTSDYLSRRGDGVEVEMLLTQKNNPNLIPFTFLGTSFDRLKKFRTPLQT